MGEKNLNGKNENEASTHFKHQRDETSEAKTKARNVDAAKISTRTHTPNTPYGVRGKIPTSRKKSSARSADPKRKGEFGNGWYLNNVVSLQTLEQCSSENREHPCGKKHPCGTRQHPCGKITPAQVHNTNYMRYNSHDVRNRSKLIRSYMQRNGVECCHFSLSFRHQEEETSKV